MAQTNGFEVHEHSYVSGPRANGGCYGRDGQWLNSTIRHSHEGGNEPHQHSDTGPACYTIDKDDWFRRTGLRGGGRKKFTTKPTGEQMPWRELEDWQKTFTVVVHEPTPEYGTGPGVAPAVRMVLGFGMKATVVDGS